MTAFALACRTAVRYKARALLAVTGVAIVGALNFDMILLSRGLLASFTDMLNSGGFDVRIIGSTGPGMVRTPVDGAAGLANRLRRLHEVEDVVVIRLEPATLTAATGHPQEVTLVGTSEASLRGAWTLVRGTDLSGDDPAASEPSVVVARRLAALLGVSPGSTVRVRVRIPGGRSALPTITCRVVGIADFSFESASDYGVAMTMAGLRFVRGGSSSDEADVVLVRSNPSAGADAAVRAITTLRPDLRVYSNEQVIAEFNRNGFAYFRQISVVLSSTTVVFAFLLVATLLTVSVNQRLGEVAALRALGMGRRRIAATLLWESALIVGVGGLAALPLGGVLAIQLDRILRRMPGLPERLHFFVFEPRALIVHLVVLAVTAVIAAVYPIWIATHLSIAETLRREVVS
jgi:putative ABC transport system permease protein